MVIYMRVCLLLVEAFLKIIKITSDIKLKKLSIKCLVKNFIRELHCNLHIFRASEVLRM